MGWDSYLKSCLDFWCSNGHFNPLMTHDNINVQLMQNCIFASQRTFLVISSGARPFLRPKFLKCCHWKRNMDSKSNSFDKKWQLLFKVLIQQLLQHLEHPGFFLQSTLSYLCLSVLSLIYGLITCCCLSGFDTTKNLANTLVLIFAFMLLIMVRFWPQTIYTENFYCPLCN